MYCFVNQHGRLVMWLQTTKNDYFRIQLIERTLNHYVSAIFIYMSGRLTALGNVACKQTLHLGARSNTPLTRAFSGGRLSSPLKIEGLLTVKGTDYAMNTYNKETSSH